MRLIDIAAGTELGRYRRFLVRDKCAEPIFVGEAKPSTRAGEGCFAFVFFDVDIAPIIIGLFVKNAHWANVDMRKYGSTRCRVGWLPGAAQQRKICDLNWGSAAIGEGLLCGNHVVFVNRQRDIKLLIKGVGPA